MASNKVEKAEKLEVLLEKLRNIVRDLEEGESPLDESLQKFEEGMLLAKSCQKKLSQAEQKIEQLVVAGKEGVHTEPFENDS